MKESSITPLTTKNEKELNELLSAADNCLSTQDVTLTPDNPASSLIGQTIGGDIGKALIEGGVSAFTTAGNLLVHVDTKAATAGGAIIGGIVAGAAGTAGTAAVVGSGTLIAGGGAIAGGMIFPPIAILALLGIAVGGFVGTKKKKAHIKEAQKQASYCKKLAEKMNQLYEKYAAEKKRLDLMHETDQETIKDLTEKLAEYELIFEAMKKKYDPMVASLG